MLATFVMEKVLILQLIFYLQVACTCTWKHQIAFHPSVWLSKHLAIQERIHMSFLVMETRDAYRL